MAVVWAAAEREVRELAVVVVEEVAEKWLRMQRCPFGERRE